MLRMTLDASSSPECVQAAVPFALHDLVNKNVYPDAVLADGLQWFLAC